MSTFDTSSILIAAAAHDVDHPGTNNLFEIKTKSKLATLYNDLSVLENHHAATLFFILEDQQCNIFEKMEGQDFNKMRKYLLENILYTDMSKHFTFVGELQNMP